MAESAGNPVVVELSDGHRQHAGRLARVRQAESERKRLEGKHGGATAGSLALRLHYLGALGEVAAAIHFGFELPTTVNTFKAPDLGEDIQVRTGSKHSYRLLVRPGDSDDELFVHATSETPAAVWLHGWMTGLDAKQPEFGQAQDGRPNAFFVPASRLRPLEQLGQRGPVTLDVAGLEALRLEIFGS